MLADLIPQILATEHRPMVAHAPGGKRLRWQKRNRKHVTDYKRAWRAARRLSHGSTT